MRSSLCKFSIHNVDDGNGVMPVWMKEISAWRSLNSLLNKQHKFSFLKFLYYLFKLIYCIPRMVKRMRKNCSKCTHGLNERGSFSCYHHRWSTEGLLVVMVLGLLWLEHMLGWSSAFLSSSLTNHLQIHAHMHPLPNPKWDGRKRLWGIRVCSYFHSFWTHLCPKPTIKGETF